MSFYECVIESHGRFLFQKAARQVRLSVKVNQKNLESPTCQAHTYTCYRGGLSYSTLVICYRYNFCLIHTYLFDYYYLLCIHKVKSYFK